MIQFKMKISENNLSFLDTLINKFDMKIWINIYTKPTKVVPNNTESIIFGLFLNFNISGMPHLSELTFWS